MIGCISKCENYKCPFNEDGNCKADNLWIDCDGVCENYSLSKLDSLKEIKGGKG